MPTVTAGAALSAAEGEGTLGLRTLAAADLSDALAPFLPHFVKETLRCGGAAHLVREGPRWIGLLLVDPLENVVSVFTRSAALVERTIHDPSGRSVYAEVDLDLPREVFAIYAAELAREPTHRFRHPVELLGDEEDRSVRSLVEETHGQLRRPWALPPAGGAESRFGVRLGGELVGVAWLALAGRSARLHTLGVRAGYRRLGIGTDLLFGRMLWAWQAGARRVVSEISAGNVASRAVAEKGGLRQVGQGFFYRGAPQVRPSSDPDPRFDYVRLAPQNGQVAAVESMSEPQ